MNYIGLVVAVGASLYENHSQESRTEKWGASVQWKRKDVSHMAGNRSRHTFVFFFFSLDNVEKY